MEQARAPLFPLPDLILFPGQILPLHIFEPRYRKMTHDLLDGTGELVIGTVLAEDRKNLDGVAPVQQVAGLARLERYEKLPDGRYMIVLLGIGRVRVTPIASTEPYPMADYSLLDSDTEIDDSLRERIWQLVTEKQEFSELPQETGSAQLVDILIMTAEIPVEDQYSFFSIESLEERATRVVEAYQDP